MEYGYISLTFTDNVLDQTKIGNPYQPTNKVVIAKYSLNSQTNIMTNFRPSHFKSTYNPLYFYP